MKKFKKQINTLDQTMDQIKDELGEEKIDPNTMDVVVDRVEHGLVGSLRIEDDMNKPLFVTGDIVHIRVPSKLEKKDFVLYQDHDEYYIRRIIKFKEDDIYVAGDTEKHFHIIHKENVIGKVLARERKNKHLSFMLKKPKKLYTFKKVNLAYFRIKNRVLGYDQELANEALELAAKEAQAAQLAQAQLEAQKKAAASLDLDSYLKNFLNPDSLVEALRKAQAGISDNPDEENDDVIGMNGQTDEEFNKQFEEAISKEVEEEVVYVDSEGNEITKEEYEALNGIESQDDAHQEDVQNEEETPQLSEEEQIALDAQKALEEQMNKTALKVAGNWLRKSKEEEKEISLSLDDDIEDEASTDIDEDTQEEIEETSNSESEAPEKTNPFEKKKVVVATTSGGIATVKTPTATVVKKANPFQKKKTEEDK